MDRHGWQTTILAGRQVDEHTVWKAGRYRAGEARKHRYLTGGNMEHKMYLEIKKSLMHVGQDDDWRWMAGVHVQQV